MTVKNFKTRFSIEAQKYDKKILGHKDFKIPNEFHNDCRECQSNYALKISTLTA